jgi:hypothetical protein
MAMVDCEACSLQDRNHAVWALGQTMARPALGTLKKHYDGERCAHESRLCQYELQKAIRLLESPPKRGVWRLLGKVHKAWS